MKSVRSVERALDALRGFAGKPVRSAADVQRDLGLSRPTVYRLLNTLEKKGFLRAVGEPRRYQLTEIALQLGNAWLSSVDVSRISSPYLQWLWEASGETVALIVPHGEDQRILIQELRSTKPLSMSLGVGYVAPLDRGTSGKTILAFLPEATVERVLRAIAGKKDRDALAAVLAQIRKQRVFATSGEVMAGGASIAAPVFGRDGAVVGAVTVFGPDARLKGEHQARCGRLVRETADAISTALGSREVQPPAHRARSQKGRR